MTDVVNRFLKYVSVGTNSDEECESCPSSPSQLVLAGIIAEDMKNIGLNDVRVDEHGYVYGYLPGKGSLADAPALGLISHMDTSPSVSGDNIKPSVVRCEGKDIPLSGGTNAITAEMFPELPSLAGEDLIVTDGTTLLGADDKAGVAEILTACERLIATGADHRPIAVGITPDEEIGRGADLFDVKGFPAKEAYTVDGGPVGEIEFENFNAASFKVTVHGVNIHPGAAKDKMKNAILMANDFISMLPPAETPSHTEGYEGFYHVMSISGDETLCTVSGLIRDHDLAKYEKRKAFLKGLCEYLSGVWGDGSFELDLRDSYFNMKEKILPHMHLITDAEKAFADEGILSVRVPIRGGTDGARLSYEGLPCPNLSTGGYGFHSCVEFIPVSSLDKMVKVIMRLVSAVSQ